MGTQVERGGGDEIISKQGQTAAPPWCWKESEEEVSLVVNNWERLKKNLKSSRRNRTWCEKQEELFTKTWLDEAKTWWECFLRNSNLQKDRSCDCDKGKRIFFFFWNEKVHHSSSQTQDYISHSILALLVFVSVFMKDLLLSLASAIHTVLSCQLHFYY